MIKKIMIGVMAAALFVGLLPVNNGLAYTGGLINGKVMNRGSDQNNTGGGNTLLVTDNDEATGIGLGSYGSTTDTIWYEFPDLVTIDSYRLRTSGTRQEFRVRFYDSSGNQLLLSEPTYINGTNINTITSLSNVKKVAITNEVSSNRNIYEFDVFGKVEPNTNMIEPGLLGKPQWPGASSGNISDNDLRTYDVVTNKFAEWSFSQATIGSVYVKSDKPITLIFYDSNIQQVGQITHPGNGEKMNLDNIIPGVSLMTAWTGSTATTVYEIEAYPTQAIPHDEIKNLSLSATHEKVKLTFDIPTTNSYFSGAKIYRDGTLLKTLGKTETSFEDINLENQKTYEYKVTALYSDGQETTGITKSVTTEAPPTPEEVKNVNIKTSYNRVDLSWNLPEQSGFKHVNIYRVETTEEPGFLESLFMGAIVSAAEESTKIFETNGTYFNDLTVKPEKTYEYTLTTQDTYGQESEGVTVEATTTAEPAPKIEGEKYEVDQNGDYLFTWEQPTEGTVKIIVGGKEYATTEAANKQFIIPKEDMQLTGLGNPDVTLQPISKYGTEGEKTSTGENNSILKLPFTVNEFVSSGFELFAYVGSFLLLALSFLLFPKLRKVIVDSFRGNRKEKGETVDRKSFRRFRDIQNEARERHEGKEHIEKTEREVKERQDKERTEKERQERERRERETAAPKEKSPRPSKERHRERKRAEKQQRRERAARAPRTPRERTRTAREPRGKRGAS